MTWSVQPEPDDETERAALIQALERALADDADRRPLVRSRWWRSGLGDLAGGSAAQERGRDPRVVEARHPRHD